MLVDKTVREILAAFSAPDPTPGGGSASALASAVGASLLLMVARLPKTRSGSDEDRAALRDAATAMTRLERALADAIDADASAYDKVVAAFKLPKGTEQEKQARKAAIQEATIAATEVPRGVMRLSASALEHAKAVEAHGNPSAASDVGVAIALLRAGFHGARLNVEINLGSVSDAAYVDGTRAEVATLAERL